MSDFSQIVSPDDIHNGEDEPKKPNWARLRGKILGIGGGGSQQTGRQRSQTTGARPMNDDLTSFLAPSAPAAPLERRHSAPRIDASASRWQQTVAQATKAEQQRDWEERQQQVRYKKPPRRHGLRVAFATTSVEIIGEGGDEAELPAVECRRSNGCARLEPSYPAGQEEPLSTRGQRPENGIAAQTLHRLAPSVNSLHRPLPATPGPTLGDRMMIMAESVADLSISTDKGYFPLMPEPLHQPGPNAFAMANTHPALREQASTTSAQERPKTAPSLGTSSDWQDSPTLPSLQHFAAARAHESRPRAPTGKSSPVKEHRPSSSLSIVQDYQTTSTMPIPPRLTSSKPLPPNPASTSPLRRNIPSPLAMNYSTSDYFDTASSNQPPKSLQHHVTSQSLPQDPAPQSNARRPQTPRKAVPHRQGGTALGYAQTGSNIPPPSFAILPDATASRNFSQPYPVTGKTFIEIRKPMTSQPGSSSSSARPSSSQSQTNSNTPDAQSALRPMSGNASTGKPRQSVQEASNAALFTFTSRTSELVNLIDTAVAPCHPELTTNVQWLRNAVWWLLGAKTDIEQMFVQPRKQADLSLIRACLNLSKSWWIVSELVVPRLSKIKLNMTHGECEVSELFRLTDALVDAIKSACLNMQQRGHMPSAPIDVKIAGLRPADIVIEVVDARFPVDLLALIGLLKC